MLIQQKHIKKNHVTIGLILESALILTNVSFCMEILTKETQNQTKFLKWKIGLASTGLLKVNVLLLKNVNSCMERKTKLTFRTNLGWKMLNFLLFIGNKVQVLSPWILSLPACKMWKLAWDLTMVIWSLKLMSMKKNICLMFACTKMSTFKNLSPVKSVTLSFFSWLKVRLIKVPCGLSWLMAKVRTKNLFMMVNSLIHLIFVSKSSTLNKLQHKLKTFVKN